MVLALFNISVLCQIANTTYGGNAGNSITTGDYNSFFGDAAGLGVTSGSDNTFMGRSAGSSMESGIENSFYGRLSGGIATGDGNSYFGHYAGYGGTFPASGDNNSFFGNESGRGITSGFGNTSFGFRSGGNISSGFRNVFIGYEAGGGYIPRSTPVSGHYNIGIGNRVGTNLSEGEYNVLIGDRAGNGITTHKGNTMIGTSSGRSSIGKENTFLGAITGIRTVGNRNIIIGYNAGPLTFLEDERATINDRLYIDVNPNPLGHTYPYPISTGNNTPLIYGEFDNDLVRINGEFEVTGGMANSSSRSLKENFEYLDPSDILTQISEMTISKWNYKTQPDVQHIGAVAEDFFEKFKVGKSNTVISTIDADGIMMLAIQALKKENDELKARLIKLEKNEK